MKFTQTQKLLMYGLMQHEMEKDDRMGAFILLRTEKNTTGNDRLFARKSRSNGSGYIKKSIRNN